MERLFLAPVNDAKNVFIWTKEEDKRSWFCFEVKVSSQPLSLVQSVHFPGNEGASKMKFSFKVVNTLKLQNLQSLYFYHGSKAKKVAAILE